MVFNGGLTSALSNLSWAISISVVVEQQVPVFVDYF
jgi:hypothetical protein